MLALYGLLALTLLACAPGVAALAALWSDFNNPDYTHGFIVAAICAGLIFRARRAIAAEPARPAPAAFVALVAAGLAWLVFWHASIQLLHLMLLPLLMGVAVWAVFGWRVARHVSFALGLLYFALPLWEVLSPLLQALTIRVVGLCLALTSVPVRVLATDIFIPEGTFQVDPACSGLHFLVVGLTLAALVGEIHRDRPRTRVLLLGLIAALALLSNWLRVLAIVVAGHLTNMRSPLVTRSHYVFGWLLFTGAMLLFIWIARRLPASAQRESPAPRPERPVCVPAAFGCAALSLAVIPLGLAAPRQLRSADCSAEMGSFPAAGPADWSGPLPPPDHSWNPVFGGASVRQQVAYRDSMGGQVEAFAVCYRSQRHGAKLIGYGNSLWGGNAFVPQNETRVESPAGPFTETTLVDPAGGQSLIWSTYLVDGRPFLSPLLSQLDYGVHALTAQPSFALVALRAQCGPSCEQARRRLQRLVADLGHDFAAR